MDLEKVITDAGWPDGSAHLHLEPFSHATVTSSNKAQKNMQGFWFMVEQK